MITVRGHALLRGADVVVYDRLVSSSLLASASPRARLIDVGKVPGASRRGAQSVIDALLVSLAREGNTVVRLKGGDPFVFGRGGEEALALAAAGVPFEVVPGVTSAIAGAAAAGIPVTHREVSSSFAVATAHDAEAPASSSGHAGSGRVASGVGGSGRAGVDWRAVAGAGTSVVLMGADRIETVVKSLIAAGKPAPTPAAVIQSATLPGQRTVCAPLSLLPAAARDAGIVSPAIIVVGDVVSLRDQIGGWDTRPLSGVRALVTRTREQSSELASILRELGAEVLEAPAIRVEPPRSWAGLDREIARLSRYEWIVLTSANGVRAFASRVQAAGLDARALAGVRVCAIGPGTADALASMGVVADFVPSSFTTKQIAADFPTGTGSVLLARADVAEPELEEALSRKGWTVRRATAYRLTGAQRMDASVRADVTGGRVDVVTFASGGTVRQFAKLLRGRPHPRTKFVCIGPVTAREARAAGFKVAKIASPHTIPALAAAVLEAAGPSERTARARGRVAARKRTPAKRTAAARKRG